MTPEENHIRSKKMEIMVKNIFNVTINNINEKELKNIYLEEIICMLKNGNICELCKLWDTTYIKKYEILANEKEFVIKNIFDITINNTDEMLEEELKNKKIFGDEILNELIIKSLSDTLLDYIKAIYYLYKNKFKCVENYGWYYLKNNKWNRDKKNKFKEIILIDFITYYEKILDYVEEKGYNRKIILGLNKIINNLRNTILDDTLIKNAEKIFMIKDKIME